MSSSNSSHGRSSSEKPSAITLRRRCRIKPLPAKTKTATPRPITSENSVISWEQKKTHQLRIASSCRTERAFREATGLTLWRRGDGKRKTPVHKMGHESLAFFPAEGKRFAKKLLWRGPAAPHPAAPHPAAPHPAAPHPAAPRSLGLGLILALRDHLAGAGGDLGLGGGEERQVMGQTLEKEIRVLDLHRWADVDLDAQHAFEPAPFLIQVNHIHRGMTVDPVLMMVSLDEHAVIVPFLRLEFLHWK